MAKADTRTGLQIESNRLDMDMFHLAEKMRAFAYKVGSVTIDNDSRHVAGMRGSVRAFMHKKDREDTGG